MREFDDMLRNLPAAYRGDKWVQDLCVAISQADGRQRTDADTLAAQMFLDSLTWALALEERIAGITSPAGATIAERREALAGKWRASTGKADLALIQRVCDAWEKGEVSAAYTDGVLVMTFINQYGVPNRMSELERAVREAAPAHIALSFIVRYRLWRDMKSYTWGAVKAHTWETVKEGQM